MGKQYLDRTGVRYGRLIAISPLKSYYSTGRAKWDWVCACDCGGSNFVTPKQSARNTSANRYLQYKGKSKTIAEWIEISNINGNTFRARLRYGWSIEKILTTPVSS